jgi:hypothetical protein
MTRMESSRADSAHHSPAVGSLVIYALTIRGDEMRDFA